MPELTSAARLKSGIALSVLFPLSTYVPLYATALIPVIGGLIFSALYFSAPFMWLFVAQHTPVLTPFQKVFVLWGHYPILGFIAGYFFPFEPTLSREYVKYAAIRYGLFVAIAFGIGLAIAFYAYAHDS